jgi:hypothetical protein
MVEPGLFEIYVGGTLPAGTGSVKGPAEPLKAVVAVK